ncbi:hypothetical protein ACFL2H_12215 [Planctomycetota bacterium]
MATLLVTTLTAYSRHSRQIETSRFRISATEAADVLLSKWFAEELIPYPSEGTCGERDAFRWTTERIRSEKLGEREVDVIQFVLTDATEVSNAAFRIELAAASKPDANRTRWKRTDR